LLRGTLGGRRIEIEGAGVWEIAAGAELAVELSSGGHWYGHGFSHVQPYPLETGEVVNRSFAVNNCRSPIWLCSAGYVLFVDTTQLLDVRLNEGGDDLLRISCESRVPLRVFSGATLPAAHGEMLAACGWPNEPPETNLFGDSIFCTWTQFPRCITEERVLDMARQIRAHKFPCSTIIIDDRWETCFGELDFSTDFPDPRAMVDELHEDGFSVWLWVTPFVNRESGVYGDLAKRGVLVRGGDGGAAPMRWWGGEAGLVDLTAPAGREWFRGRLLRLRDEFGVDGFKVDGGDFKYQPPRESAKWHDYRGPSGYADELLSLIEEIAPGRAETRTTWLSQGRRILWRQGGKDSHWGIDNGLRGLVSLALHMGLLGYDILMPDMVPGRVQTLEKDFPLPTDELMVRWAEASAVMPVLQFSYFPWNYCGETEAAVLGWARFHKALEDYLGEAAADRRAPLVRPIWYDAPHEEALYDVSDELMLGGDLLAAPVLEPGATAREVILPPGKWRDAWTGAVETGGGRKSVPAPCPGMPVFVREGNEALFGDLNTALSEIRRGCVASGVTTATYEAGIDRDVGVTG